MIGEVAGQPCTYRSFPDQPHFPHAADPALFTTTLVEWTAGLSGR